MDGATTVKLVSLSPLPGWAVVLLAVAVALGVLLAGWGVRKEAIATRRLLLWSLRALAGVLALGFLLEPGQRKVNVARVKNRVAVLVDRSASMRFPTAKGGPSRAQAVAKALTALKPQLDALSDRFAFELIGFDPELAPVSLDVLGSRPPDGQRTDLLGALKALKAQEAGSARKLSGVLLLSDGSDTTETTRKLDGSELKDALAGLGVAVSTVAVAQGSLEDVAIESVKVDDFAFVRNSLTAEVTIRAQGFAGQLLPVTLKREGQVVATKQVAIAGDDHRTSVSFTFSPDQTGRFVYTVSAPVLPGEALTENNQKAFTLKVIRDRVRVLLVAGRPTWDERFLRGILKQDANVELISFYILRSNADEVLASESELSLIPFPRDEIFDKKIDTFDLIVIMNFGHAEQGVSLEMFREQFSRYVSNGGALAYVGGDMSFSEARGRTPFDQLLPLEPAGPALQADFRARPTADGLRHPMLQVGGFGESTAALWAALPAIPGMNLTRARPGAAVLLENPDAPVGGAGAPLLAVWEVGRGRALALATDASWYWAFTSHAAGAPTRLYERLWSNAIRWLVRDPELTSLSVGAEAPQVEPGKPVAAVVQARTSDYQPAPNADVIVELVRADTGQVVGTQSVRAGEDGVARVEFPTPGAGAYKLKAQSSRDGQPLGEASDAVAVRSVGPELAQASADPELLQAIAKATGGKFFALDALALDEVPLQEPPLVEVGRSKDEPLWDRWYWLVLLIAVAGAEWAVRRRFGYV